MLNSSLPVVDTALLTIIKPLGKPITLIAGEIVEAEIIDILDTGGITLKIKGGFLTAKAEIPVERDSTAFFKVLTGESGRELRLQFIGYSGRPLNEQVRNNQQITLMDKILQDLSVALLREGTGSKSFPEFLEKIFRALPIDVRSTPKEFGIQVQNLLRESLESTGFFQAFLSFGWRGVKDAEIKFKKFRRNKMESYSCRLSLDLAKYGRLSVTLLMLNNEFFAYFKADTDKFKEILSSCIDELKDRFTGMGSGLRVTFLDKDISVEELERLHSSEGIIDIKV